MINWIVRDTYQYLELFNFFVYLHKSYIWGGPLGVMVKALDFGIVVSEFEFQLRYNVNFRKSMNPLIHQAMG